MIFKFVNLNLCVASVLIFMFKLDKHLSYRNLQAGIALTSAVTTQFTPRLDRAPRIIPQGRARN